MKKNNLLYLLLISIFVISCNKSVPGEEEIINPPQPPATNNFIFPKKEMRAVWITTAWELDWPMGKYDIQAQKDQYIQYLEKFKSLNINTVIFQVKPMGDAFYNSPYEPWSKYITGERGKNPGYDLLKFLIDEAHKRDIEFHAWMNPYRIGTRASSSQSFPALHSSIKPEWVINHEKIQIYNPAIPEVQQRLGDIVKDLIVKYDVDGIHFDDYFYPVTSVSGVQVSDADDYKKYGAGFATIEDFRRDNVNKAIKLVHDVIVANKPQVVFSISPAPNQNENYNTHYADVTKWCQEGWIDVVMPQLYQEIGNKYNDFQTNLGWWSQYNYKAALMIGHGYYKFGDETAGSSFQSTTELEKQFNLTRAKPKVVGNAMYSARFILFNKIGITDKLSNIYKYPGVIPFLGRQVAPDPMVPTNVRIENNVLKWEMSKNLKAVVYHFSDTNKEGKVISITQNNSIPISEKGFYIISCINVDNKESSPSEAINYK